MSGGWVTGTNPRRCSTAADLVAVVVLTARPRLRGRRPPRPSAPCAPRVRAESHPRRWSIGSGLLPRRDQRPHWRRRTLVGGRARWAAVRVASRAYDRVAVRPVAAAAFRPRRRRATRRLAPDPDWRCRRDRPGRDHRGEPRAGPNGFGPSATHLPRGRSCAAGAGLAVVREVRRTVADRLGRTTAGPARRLPRTPVASSRARWSLPSCPSAVANGCAAARTRGRSIWRWPPRAR